MRHKLSTLTLIPIFATLSSCALFNPYVDRSPRLDEPSLKGTATYNAKKLTNELKSKSSQLAYWQSGSTSAIALALGLGGYRAVDGGHAAQVAALAAGSATIYGFSVAQYKPEKERIYLSGVQAATCTMNIYEPSSLNAGKLIKQELQKKRVTNTDKRKPKKSIEELFGTSLEFNAAFAKSIALDVKYNESIDALRISIDNYINELQPPPEVTYRVLRSIISPTKPQTSPDDLQSLWDSESPLNNKVNNYVITNTDGYVLNDEDIEIIMKAVAWTENVNNASSDIETLAAECNHFGMRPPRILGITQGSKIQLPLNGRLVYAIFDSSENLTTEIVAQDDSDNGKLRAQIITNEGKLSLELVGGGTASTKPIRVSVIDKAKGGFSITFEVDVKN
ncbi:hypothetical protein ACK25U_10335 [Ectopseudomonas mendocina]